MLYQVNSRCWAHLVMRKKAVRQQKFNFLFYGFYFFSAPEPKAQVHYCNHALSFLRLLFTFHILDIFSETAERNSTKLDRKQDLNVLHQVCVFLADRKNKLAAVASDWLKHFWLLLWNHWREFNQTWCKILMSSTKFVFSGPIGKTRWPPWRLIGWDIFDFSSETAEQNPTKRDRKQDLNVLY